MQKDQKDKLVVRLAFTLEEAEALDHAMASTLESEMMIFMAYDGKDELLSQARKGAMRLRQGIARVLDPQYTVDKKEEYINRMQVVTRAKAKQKYRPWTDEEKAYLLESDEHLLDIALALGRTFRGVKEMRKKLRRRLREKGTRIAGKRGRRWKTE